MRDLFLRLFFYFKDISSKEDKRNSKKMKGLYSEIMQEILYYYNYYQIFVGLFLNP